MNTPDAPHGVTVSVTADIVHRCPFVDETDHGTIIIGWTCRDTTLELHDLAAYLLTWKDVAVSHEALVDGVRTYLAVRGVRNVTVSATFRTAGMTVTAAA